MILIFLYEMGMMGGVIMVYVVKTILTAGLMGCLFLLANCIRQIVVDVKKTEESILPESSDFES